MAFFGGNGVELMVDPSPPPTKTGKPARASEGGREDGVDGGVLKPAVQKTTSGVEASASPPESGGRDAPTAAGACKPPPPLTSSVAQTRGVVMPPAAAAVVTGREKEASVDSALPPSQPSAVDKDAITQSAVPPASPPHGDCALVGEDTCMALFGGDGVELLVDPPPSQAGSATGLGEGGAEEPADGGAAETAEKAGQQPTTPPEADAATLAETKRAMPASSPLRAADGPLAGLNGAPPVVAENARIASSSPPVADGAEGTGVGSTDGGTGVVSETPKGEAAAASPARPRGRKLDGGEAAARTAAAATPVVEHPSPPPGSRPPPLFRMGMLPSRARCGRPKSPAPAAGAAPPAATAEKGPPSQGSAGPSTSTARALPRPPSAVSEKASSLSTGAGVNRVAVVSEAATEGVLRVASQATDAEAGANVRVLCFL